jgi:ribosomal protein S12 methylthiotransferase
MNKSKIAIVSLGCPRNLVDSEHILGRLDLKGYRIVDADEADVAIVNTCSFVEDAKRESIDAILDLIRLKKDGNLKKVIVCGCLSERYKDRLRKQLPEVDAFVGSMALNHDKKRYALTPAHYAYLKICEGCINNCSYCVIPKIKSKFTSLDEETVLKKVREFDKNKVSELNIIGQDITGYGIDLYGKKKLATLLKKIAKTAKNIGWIRLLYLYPSRVSDELLSVIKDEPRICRYIDLPIQHINGRILKLMNRHTDKNRIVRLIEKIRKTIPDVGLRTSVIVGFPSETEKEFGELLDFIGDIKFERLGAFMYSPEETTAAYGFKGQVPEKIKRDRFNAIMSAQQSVSEDLNKRFLGQSLEVLIDEEIKGSYMGRTQYDAPDVDGAVYVKSCRPLKAGDFVKVRITDTMEYDLAGEVKR